MTIEEILAGESKNVEFKENLPEKSIKYMKSVVAFALPHCMARQKKLQLLMETIRFTTMSIPITTG